MSSRLGDILAGVGDCLGHFLVDRLVVVPVVARLEVERPRVSVAGGRGHDGVGIGGEHGRLHRQRERSGRAGGASGGNDGVGTAAAHRQRRSPRKSNRVDCPT